MPREKEAYRDNLERLCEKFPDKELLNVSEVVKFLGVSRRYVEKAYPFKGNKISKATLARILS